MNKRILKLALVLIIAVALFAGLDAMLGAVSAAQTNSDSRGALRLPRAFQTSPDEFPVITDTAVGNGPEISGDCVAFRDGNGRVYLHSRTSGETITVTDKTEPGSVRRVVVSQGVVVWGSDRAGEAGLWGYYNPSCSDAGIFGTEVIGPFYIVSRAMAHAPALSGEMLTFDTWAPAGAWYVALIELDENDNGVPDAIEDGYDPTNPVIFRLSCCRGGPHVTFWQRISDVYLDDDYGLACWSATNSAGLPSQMMCTELKYRTELQPWEHQFVVNNDTWIAPKDFSGIISIYRDLVVWTGSREPELSGYDLYIADLDLDDDGILNHEDPTPGDGPSQFVLVNFPWDQEYPDMWGTETSPGEWQTFVVWTDRRNGNQPDIYAYDLNLDSDGDGVPNWRDPNRPCIDPAEIRVTFDPAAQVMPEIWNGTVVWQDWRNGNGDVYGAQLESVQPQLRTPVSGTSQEKAVHWLDQQTVHFPQVQDIPGYIVTTGMITRYKSFTQDGVEHVRQAWYPAIPGSYLVSFDFCYYGTPDQKRYLGRFGRGFTYDQGLTLIARSMLSQPEQAEDLGHYVSSFRNSGQLSTTVPGSFGFSFNGQGYWGEKDNFYDMDYLRGGANGWLGYGYLFYDRQFGDDQFRGVMTQMADYLLDLQVLEQGDIRYGLFRGGYGRWFKDLWFDQDITWVSTEHNIDIYFFLRDLGQRTGDVRYTNAANLLKENLPRLWDESKGRLNQGASNVWGMDTADALDASSWGAMYWIATGDLDKARRSLGYADAAFKNTVTVSDTINADSEITVWGYKPYNGVVDEFDWTDVDMVWSEGSLGVAMANLKLGHAMQQNCDFWGSGYVQKAQSIVAEMEKLQELDPEGGLFYTTYPGEVITESDVITDFAKAPSAAGTTWLLMVQKAMEDGTVRDAFWGTDEDPEWICPSISSVWLPMIMKDAQ